MLVAACLLLLVWKLRKAELFPRMAVPVFSCLIACAGAYWFFERIAASS